MKLIGEFIKSTLVGGLLVILPLCFVAILVMKVVELLVRLLTPIVERLPDHLRFPGAIAVSILVLACLATGLVARTRAGKKVGELVEAKILNRIPGYSMVRSLTRRMGNVEETDKFAPVFAEIEDALVPAFVVEEHADGRYTVFVPSSPTPAVGAVYVMTGDRVHFVDAPFLKSVQCISRWGTGSEALLKTLRPESTAKSP